MGDLRPTEEQEVIIDSAAKGESFVVEACAGSGKSTTLRLASKNMMDMFGRPRDILYLVYNKAAAVEAEAVFPEHVTVRTLASLGYRDYAYQDGNYKERMDPEKRRLVPARETTRALGINEPLDLGGSFQLHPDMLARMAGETVDKYAYTADELVEEHHVPVPPGLDLIQEEYLRAHVCELASKLWNLTIRPSSSLRFEMDYAFKLFVMGNPSLSYDAVMLDEAQDSNGIVEHFIKNQRVQTVIVGDSCQALYGWRGATDILDRFPGERLHLTQSWRFGEDIAEEANKWLAHANASYSVRGNPKRDSIVTDGDIVDPDAILCRYNVTAMSQAIHQLKQGKRVAMAGGTESLVNLAKAAENLRKGEQTAHPKLVAFESWDDLVAYTDEPGGGDLKPLVSLINIYGVPGVIAACRAMVEETQPRWGWRRDAWQPPQVVVSTGHKAKGREWDGVQVAGDFTPPSPVEDPITKEFGPGLIQVTEAMLNYVMVTRARHHLDRGGLHWIDTHLPINQPSLAKI